MKETVTLEGKDVRQIIADYLGISVDNVIPNRYTYSVVGITAEDVKKRMRGACDDGNTDA